MPDTNVSSGPSWLKSGSAATAHAQAAAYQAEKAKEAANKMRRFWLKPGQEATVSFLDGDLDKDGVIKHVAFNEHFVMVNGKPDNFICVAESEICPLCASGNNASFVAAFTVCNHTPYTIQKGPNAGKTVENQRQLYIAKLGTLRKLQSLATKRGGLRGWRMEIGRSSDKDANVGDMFQFLGEGPKSEEQLVSLYGDNGKPADYGKELTYMTAKELLAAGLGKAPVGPGYGKGGAVLSNEDISDAM